MVKHLILMSPFNCKIPFHSSKFVAGLVSFFITMTFQGNMSHMRTIYQIVLHLEGFRWPSLLEHVREANLDALVLAGMWDCDPLMRILGHARLIHRALPNSIFHGVQRGTHMTR